MKHIVQLLGVVYLFSTFPANAQLPDNTKDWTILEAYTIPGKASGLAYDGTYFYFGFYGTNGDQVHRFDPSTGNTTLQFTNSSINDCFGMTWDGSSLWITDHVTSPSVPASAIELDLSGTILSQFDLPDHYMSGIAYDNGDFWVSTYYPDPGTIYKVDYEGTILGSFTSPGMQSWDICVQENDLWIAEYNGNLLYKVDNAGVILESHPSENVKPAGIVFDGQYLWYVDGGTGTESTLYKVDLGGLGTPQIDIPVTNYNYGNVTINNSVTWNCLIQNTGTADLVITNLVIQNAVPIFIEVSFPINIPVGSNYELPIIYNPTESGTLNTIVTVECNDPVTPAVELTLTGEAVNDGPHINLVEDLHNYGNVRSGATTRWFIQIYNDGDSQLMINDITITEDEFYLDNGTILPIGISPLDTASIGIWFNPDMAGNYNGLALITHNDASQGDIEVELSGNGVEQDFPMGDEFWFFNINTSWDNSVKAISSILDVTDDGVDDVIVSSEDDFVRCFNGNSSGIADIIWEYEDDAVYSKNGLTTIEDINNDGYDDVIVGYAWGSRSVKALSGKTGEMIWVYDTHVYGDGGWVYQIWTAFDYNDDGVYDVLAATGNDGNNTGPKRIFCLDGLSGVPIWEANTNGPNFAVIGVEDFTGDGIPDVIGGASNNTEMEGKVYGINGDSGSILWEFTTSASSVWALVQIDDINNDGVPEIGAGDFGGHFYAIDPVNGNSIYNGSIGGSPIILNFEALDDVNGDGFMDFSVASSSANAITINGQTGQNVWLQGLSDKVWNIDQIADVSGDGINDLVAGTLYSSNYCYFIDGTNGNELFSNNFGEPIDAIAAIPDINGDGSMEMVVGGRDGALYCYSGGLNANMLNADFVADTTNGFAPLEVNFTDLSIGSPDSWEWDFDNDGVIDSYDQHPNYIYNLPGLYSVKLRVSSGSLFNSIIKTDYINVELESGFDNPTDNASLSIYPNPFSKLTNISFQAISNSNVQIIIYNLQGSQVRYLMQEGSNTNSLIDIEWDGTNDSGYSLPEGIYILELKTDQKFIRRKLVISE